VLLGCVLVNVTGCGARTGLEVGDLPFDRASGDDGGEPGEGTGSSGGGSSGGGPFCALHVGPIPTCHAPASDGPVAQCDPPVNHCVNVDGQWGCCTSDSDNNGPGGVCSFPGLLPDPCATRQSQGIARDVPVLASH
jgi:hypothetical protein